jgi:hypothetical protein
MFGTSPAELVRALDSPPTTTDSTGNQVMDPDLQKKVDYYITSFGLDKYIEGPWMWRGSGYVVKLTQAGLSWLKQQVKAGVFKQGPWVGALLHWKDVGAERPWHMIDFRSLTSASFPLSMQVAVDRFRLGAWIDLDRFNPYQDLVGFFGHFILEVIPVVWR